MNQTILADNLDVLPHLEDGSIPLIYIDPPFNTGKRQARRSLRTVRDASGDRTGFQDNRYATEVIGQSHYDDDFDDYLGFLEPRLREAHRVLSPSGSLYFHIDYREVHYCKVVLDSIFGRDSFLNEIIWAYDTVRAPRASGPPSTTTSSSTPGTPSTTPSTTTTSTGSPTWRPASSARRRQSAARRPPTSGGTRSCPRTAGRRPGTQHRSRSGSCDASSAQPRTLATPCSTFFAGSGTTGAAAAELGRKFILIDSNPTALQVMAGRLGHPPDANWVGYEPGSPETAAA